jgi:hypothetical protein
MNEQCSHETEHGRPGIVEAIEEATVYVTESLNKQAWEQAYKVLLDNELRFFIVADCGQDMPIKDGQWP